MAYTTADCIEGLEKAARQLGKSPTHKEYTSLDINPSASAIIRICGSWNEAKSLANLSQDIEPRVGKCPEYANPDKEWSDLSPATRLRHRKKSRCAKYKLERGCSRCGYDEAHQALDFHHTNPDNKIDAVATLIQDCKSDEIIEAEVEKCEVLCANCHRLV
jgi:hypothetical protein